jgi:dienelactone hydrolase
MIGRSARIAGLAFALLAGAPARAESSLVHFEAPMADGGRVELAARLVKPDGDGPFAAIVLLHGCDGTDLHSDWVERSFGDWPYAFLDVDSLGPRGVAHACEGYGQVSPTMRARDADAARRWLAAQPFIDKDRIAVMGWSMGAETVLKATSNPYFNEPDRTDRFAAAVAFYPYCPFKLRRPDAPMLLLIGGADDWTPPGTCRAMQRIGDDLPPFELVEYPNATHAFDWAEAPAQYFGHRLRHDAAATADAYARVRAFLAKYLK